MNNLPLTYIIHNVLLVDLIHDHVQVSPALAGYEVII